MNVTITQSDADAPENSHLPEAQAPTTPEQIGASVFDDSSALDAGLDDINVSEAPPMVPFVLTRDDNFRVRVFIKTLDILSVLDIEAGRLLVRGNAVLRAPARESKLGLALEIAAAVYRRVGVAAEGGDAFEPMFTDVAGAQKWMGNAANKSLVAQVMAGIYAVNPEMSPEKKMRAALKSQMQATG